MAKMFLDPLVVRGEPDSDIIDIWQRSDGVGSYLEPAVFLGDVAKRHAIFLFYDFVLFDREFPVRFLDVNVQ